MSWQEKMARYDDYLKLKKFTMTTGKKLTVIIFSLLIIFSCLIAAGRVAAKNFSWPLDQPTHLTSSFGEIRANGLHNGIDFSTLQQRGRPVLAVDEGQVEKILFDPVRYGKTIVIGHPSGYRSWYSHLERFSETILKDIEQLVEPNLKIIPDTRILVNRGEKLGIAGETGRGPVHLHFALQSAAGYFINPIGYFDPPLSYNPVPVIDSLRLIPVDGESWVNGGPEEQLIDFPTDETVNLWGRIGFAVNVRNFHPGNANRSLPYRTEILLNDEPVSRRLFDKFSADEIDTAAAEYFYLGYSNIVPTEYCLKMTGNRFSEIGTEYISFMEPGDTGWIEIRSHTKTGEMRSRRINYQIKLPPRAKDWSKIIERLGVGLENNSNFHGEERFITATLEDHQREQRQYSPPLFSVEETSPEINLIVTPINNRIKIEFQIDGNWNGWPEIVIESSGHPPVKPEPIQVEPGRFISWWAPSLQREGWHEVTVDLPGEDRAETQSVYLQNLIQGRAGAVSSPDGIFTLFSDGTGLNYSSKIIFQRLNDIPPIPAGVERVGPAYRMEPSFLQTTGGFYLNAMVPADVEHPEKVGVYRLNKVSGEWEVLSFEGYSRQLFPREKEVQLFEFPVVALFKDSINPEIEKIYYDRRSDQIRIKISETGSGYNHEDLLVKTTDRKMTSYFDQDNHEIVLSASQLKAADAELLQVELVDRAGNRIKQEFTVSSVR